MTSELTPCVGICQTATINGEQMCVGCYRTLTEIASWSALPLEARLSIIDMCGEREWNHTKGLSL